MSNDTAAYLEAMDILEANKNKIAKMDLLARQNTLAKAKNTRRNEASLIVFNGADVDRLAAIRRANQEEMKKIDKKNGAKYWESLAKQVGIKWIA